MTENSGKILAEFLRPYSKDENSFGDLYADLVDSVAECQQILNSIESCAKSDPNADALETLLINLDIRFEHLATHIASFRAVIPSLLDEMGKD